MTNAMPCAHQHKKLVNALWCGDCGAYNELDGNNWQLPSGRGEEDISIYGQYIEKDGKRIEPKDFYKPPSGKTLSCDSIVTEIDKFIERHPKAQDMYANHGFVCINKKNIRKLALAIFNAQKGTE